MRNNIEIIVWMKREKIKQSQISQECGKHKAHVWETIHGKRNDRLILAWLINKGCPAEILDLPVDLREAA